MTTYVLFAYDTYYPCGGLEDILATWESTMEDEGNCVLAERHIAQEKPDRSDQHELVAIDGEHVRRVGEWSGGTRTASKPDPNLSKRLDMPNIAGGEKWTEKR